MTHEITSGFDGQITPFKREVRPLVKDSNPYVEDPHGGIFGSLNSRAMLVDVTHLYEGNPYVIKQSGKETHVQGFMDIRQRFMENGYKVDHHTLFFGLRNIETEEDIDGYYKTTTYPDPLQTYRHTKALELLPELTYRNWQQPTQLGEGFEHVNMAVEVATTRTFYKRVFPTASRETVHLRRKVGEVIGRANLREIMTAVPPRLEEMYQTIIDICGAPPATQTLERDIRARQIFPSEYLVDLLHADRKYMDSIREQLRGLNKMVEEPDDDSEE